MYANDRKDAEFGYTNFVEPLGLLEFNNCDQFAREAMQDFCEKMDGWSQEQLSSSTRWWSHRAGWQRPSSAARNPGSRRAPVATDNIPKSGKAGNCA